MPAKAESKQSTKANAKESKTVKVQQKKPVTVSKEQKPLKSKKSEEKVAQPKEQKVKQEKKTKSEEKSESQVEQSSSEYRFEQQYSTIRDEIKSVRETLSNLSSSLKKLESAYNHDIKKVKKSRPRRKNGEHKPTGFIKTKPVPKKFASFLGVKEGSEMSGPSITREVWKQLKERNLVSEKDKRVFRTNKEVSELFGVPLSVNKSDDHTDVKKGFNFCNLQTYIANAMKQ